MLEATISHAVTRGLPHGTPAVQIPLRITALGGGTGLAVLLRGLFEYGEDSARTHLDPVYGDLMHDGRLAA